MVTTNIKVTDFSVQSDNKNYLKFSATAGFVGTPTRATPNGGSKGYKIVIENAAADNINELVGAGVNCSWGWSDSFKTHDKSFKIGVIDNAIVEDGKILVEGHLWKSDFPDICDTIESSRDSLGCSIEIFSNGFLMDDETKIETLQDVHFTGMAIVYKNKAAFEGTNFMCSIRDDSDSKKDIDMTTQEFLNTQTELTAEMQKKLDDFSAAFTDAIAKIDAKLDAMNKDSGHIERQTQQFESTPQFQKPKSIMELSKEIDDDPSLSTAEQWSKKLALWKAHEKEDLE